MEAIAKFPFEKRDAEELTLRKGAKVKLLDYWTEDDDWVKAELDGCFGLVAVSYLEIKPAPWFKNCKTRDEASGMLLKKNDKGKLMYPDGAFLIRPSSKAPAGFALTVKTGIKVQHFMIFQQDISRRYYLWDSQCHFETLNEMVDFYRKTSVHKSEKILLRDMKEPDERQMVVVRYKFEPREADELTLAANDIVAVIDDSDKDWWRGEIIQGAGKGKVGLFPGSYVTPVPSN